MVLGLLLTQVLEPDTSEVPASVHPGLHTQSPLPLTSSSCLLLPDRPLMSFLWAQSLICSTVQLASGSALLLTTAGAAAPLAAPAEAARVLPLAGCTAAFARTCACNHHGCVISSVRHATDMQ